MLSSREIDEIAHREPKTVDDYLEDGEFTIPLVFRNSPLSDDPNRKLGLNIRRDPPEKEACGRTYILDVHEYNDIRFPRAKEEALLA